MSKIIKCLDRISHAGADSLPRIYKVGQIVEVDDKTAASLVLRKHAELVPDVTAADGKAELLAKSKAELLVIVANAAKDGVAIAVTDKNTKEEIASAIITAAANR